MKKLISNILIGFSLQACATIPEFDPEIRRTWSVQFNRCYCATFDLNISEAQDDLLPCEDYFNKHYPDQELKPNYMYCDDLIGFNAKAWAIRITPKIKEIRRFLNDHY